MGLDIFEKKKKTPKYQTLPTKPTQIPESPPCYMFDQASPSYSQNFPPLESLIQGKETSSGPCRVALEQRYTWVS